MENNKRNLSIEELAFALTQHADDLQMFANGVAMEAYGSFEQTESAIMELIYQLYERYQEKGLNPDRNTVNYLEKLKDRIEEIRNSFFEDELDEIAEQSREVAKNESKFLKAFYIALTGINVAVFNNAWYDKISKNGIYDGGTVAQIFDKLLTSDVTRIFQTMITSVRAGKRLEDVRQLVKDELKKSKRYLKDEIEVVINGVANDVAMAFAVKNGCALLYCTALDNRVCKECMKYSGKIFTAHDKDMPSLPRHVNCRCRYVPVPAIYSEYEKLEMSFKDYFNKLTEEEKSKRLGKKKYDLYKSGEYSLKFYETPLPEQQLTITQLKERDKNLFK